MARSRGARPPRPCSSAPSPMSLLSTTARRARRSPRRPQHARARVVPETVRSTNLAAPVTPQPHPPTRGFGDSRVTRCVMRPPCQVGRGLRTRRALQSARRGRRALPQAPVTPQPHPPRAGSGTPHSPPPQSRMRVRKHRLFPHRDVRFDRPLENQDHVTVSRDPRSRRQFIQPLDCFHIKLHGNRTGFALGLHSVDSMSPKMPTRASIHETAGPRCLPILKTYHINELSGKT